MALAHNQSCTEWFGNAQARFPTVGTLRRTFFSFVFVATLHSFYLGYLVKAFK